MQEPTGGGGLLCTVALCVLWPFGFCNDMVHRMWLFKIRGSRSKVFPIALTEDHNPVI